MYDYNKFSTEAGNALVGNGITKRLGYADCIIFDYDGVLVGVSRSIMQVHNKTAEYYFRMQGWFNTFLMVTDADVELFKLAGGFNNDWDLAYAWGIFYWAKHRMIGSVDGERLKYSTPSLEEYITCTAELGGGLESANEVLCSLFGEDEIRRVESRFNQRDFISLFKQVYSGDLSREMYEMENDLIKGPGLINNDVPILNSSLLPKHTPVGIATGRTLGEARVGIRLMGWNRIFPGKCIVTEDDGFVKPDPEILHLAVERVGGTHPVYVGDTPDDLLTVTRYKAMGKDAISCMVVSGMRNPSIIDIFVGQGADIIADNVNVLLILMNRYIGGNNAKPGI